METNLTTTIRDRQLACEKCNAAMGKGKGGELKEGGRQYQEESRGRAES